MDKHLDAETLSDYAEGLAEARTRAAADAHLKGCAQCRSELAAIQAYFRDVADLEPARAPSDFLSRVRARLPRPSRWERAWAALLIPFRSIPVPIAVAVILGVTAITVYMRQGGPETRVLIPAPDARPASGPASESAPESAKPTADGNSPAASQPALKDIGRAEDGSISPARPKPRSVAKKGAKPLQPTIPEAGPGEAAGSGGAAAASPAPSAFAPPAPVGSLDTKQSPAKTAPAPVRQSSTGAAQKLRDVEVQGWLDNPSSVYILDNSSTSPNLPLDKTMPVEEKTAVPGQAEAAAGHAAKRKAEEESRKEADDGMRTAPEKQAAPARVPLSGYALSLRAKGDTAAVLAGLRSMGVEAEPEYASPGESRFRLIVPAPMLRELGPYLSRHGESRPEGQLPAAVTGPALSIRLRLLFPVR